MSTVLITGATGFVGSHLARRLVGEGADVHVLCRSTSNVWRLSDVLPRLRRWDVDLRDAQALTAAVHAIWPDRVFHLASATVVAGVAAGAAELVNVNLLGTVNLLEACDAIGYQGMVTTGDSFEYAPSAAPLGPGTPCLPAGLHGITKLAATLHAQAVARSHGRPIVVLRLFSAYGPGDNPRRLVPRVIAGALAGSGIRLSRPEIARDWIYVGDLVDLYMEAAARAASCAGGVFNAGTGTAASIADIVDLILRLTGSAARPDWGVFPAAEHDAFPWIADMRPTYAAFDWRPATTLEAGMRMTIAGSAEAPA